MKKITRLSLIVTLLVLTSFSNPKDIVRRHDVKDSKYLELGSKYPAVCKVGAKGGDGTLIGSSWVITAAHVAEGMSKRSNGKVEVYFSNRTTPYMAEAIFLHPEYQMLDHDIAIIKLSETVNIPPLKFNTAQSEKGQKIVIVGHGYAKNGRETEWIKDGKKRAATNTIDDVNAMHILFDFDKPGDPGITELEGTAGAGDSGGPALMLSDGEPTIVGISSAGEPGENGPGTYGATEYYTRVSTHSDWIEKVLSGQVKPTNLSAKREENGDRVVVRKMEGLPPGMIKELGLIVGESGGKVEIHGKVDELVPNEIASVAFRAPSYVSTVNSIEIGSVQQLKKVLNEIKKGEEVEITFKITGDEKTYKIKK